MKLHSSDRAARRAPGGRFWGVGTYDVVVTTYEMAKAPSLRSALVQKVTWRCLVLDEGHVIKNHETEIARTVRKMHFVTALLLTGTPLQNNLVELWALLNFLHPAAFPDVEPFAKAYDLGRGVVDRDMLVKAQVVLGQLMLRRLKVDVETGLPPKLETVVQCPLAPQQVFCSRPWSTFWTTTAGGWSFCRLTGATNRVRRVRQASAAFNEPSSPLFIFLMTAGGLGINLQSADTCVLYDSDWNPQADLQAMARVHRLGQSEGGPHLPALRRGTAGRVLSAVAEEALPVPRRQPQRRRREGDDDMDKLSGGEVLSMVKFSASAIFKAATTEPSDADLDAIVDRSRGADDVGKPSGKRRARVASSKRRGRSEVRLCPMVVHASCAVYNNLGEDTAMGTWQCPHHACVGCGRSTSAAGGLLFRCEACPVTYCEDCLPRACKVVGECRRHLGAGGGGAKFQEDLVGMLLDKGSGVGGGVSVLLKFHGSEYYGAGRQTMTHGFKGAAKALLDLGVARGDTAAVAAGSRRRRRWRPDVRQRLAPVSPTTVVEARYEASPELYAACAESAPPRTTCAGPGGRRRGVVAGVTKLLLGDEGGDQPLKAAKSRFEASKMCPWATTAAGSAARTSARSSRRRKRATCLAQVKPPRRVSATVNNLHRPTTASTGTRRAKWRVSDHFGRAGDLYDDLSTAVVGVPNAAGPFVDLAGSPAPAPPSPTSNENPVDLTSP
ncbi:helicase [Aureococcus anophagefferens]|nr:helicase [Aureococcus anophagefferens]